MKPAQNGYHGQRDGFAPGHENHSGSAGYHNDPPGVVSNDPGPSTSRPRPRIVINQSSSGSWDGNKHMDIRRPTLATPTRERSEPPSTVSEKLDDFLCDRSYEHAYMDRVLFWTLPLLREIVTHQRVMGALENSNIKGTEAVKIARIIVRQPEPTKPSYIKIFCILVLCGMTRCLLRA